MVDEGEGQIKQISIFDSHTECSQHVDIYLRYIYFAHVSFSYLQESLVACAAFKALSMFDPSDFKLIHLPEKVQ